MENPIIISKINDFVFCPVSIYFHSLDENIEKVLYQSSYQLNGTTAHKSIDERKYSDKKNILQGIDVYSEEYDLVGKIDIFDTEKHLLTERKNKIKNIYDGYVFQLYAEYLCLIEMGYIVNEMRLYSVMDNKIFMIKKPEEDKEMFEKFKDVIVQMQKFSYDDFAQKNEAKCKNCIYENLCSYSKLKD